jgi:hypothetical protein
VFLGGPGERAGKVSPPPDSFMARLATKTPTA